MTKSRNYIATPPGATIKEQLVDRGMSQKEFAARMDMSEKHISKLINGDVFLTYDVAVRLEMVLGVPARFWNNLEAIYREKLIKVDAEKSMEEEMILASQFPYAEMAKFGWVPATRSSTEKVYNLRKFFGVVQLSLLENQQITRIACRRLGVTEKSDLALMAWAQEAKILSREMNVAPINLKALTTHIQEIKAMSLLSPDEFCSDLKTLFASYGIALVFLPHLKGSFLQGASFLDGDRIILGLTTRGCDADRFWFSMFHELGHIILGHVMKTGGTSVKEESEADAWARAHLIPDSSFMAFSSMHIFTRESIQRFASTLQISPGIVVGRLQNEGMIPYSMFNDMKQQYTISI